MSEYIERGALVAWLDEVDGIIADGTVEAPTLYKQVITDIKQFPTTDVVEVTRCKNCIHAGYINSTLYCYYLSRNVDEDFGCIDGHDVDGGADNG